MHEVSNAINLLDVPNTIDTKICGTGANNWVKNAGGDALPAKEEEGKCSGLKSNATSETNFKQLSHMFSAPTNEAGKITYTEDKDHKMGGKTSAKISKDITTALNRD